MTTIALLLGACGTVPRSDSMQIAGNAQIRGSAFYLEHILMPPDTVLDVQLINGRLVDTPAAVVAEQQFEHLQGPPLEHRRCDSAGSATPQSQRRPAEPE